MKIKEIITEDDEFNQYEPHNPFAPRGPLTPAEVKTVNNYKQLADIIETNCGQMLSVYRKTNKILWCRIHNVNESAVIMNIRPDRLPVEMPLKAHYRLKKVFDYLGLKANRSNSIFCTTNMQTAGDWGKPFVIFVRDGWVGTVWQSLPDEYFFDEVYNSATDPRFANDIPGLAERIKELQPLVVTPENLDGVLYEDFKDILITGTSYIGLRYGTEPYLNVIELLNLHPTN